MKERFVLVAAALLMPFFALAQANVNQGAGDISQSKQKIHQHIQERVHTLESTDACVSAAETRDAMRACREAQRASMKGARAEHKAEHRAEQDQSGSVRDARRKRGSGSQVQ